MIKYYLVQDKRTRRLSVVVRIGNYYQTLGSPKYFSEQEIKNKYLILNQIDLNSLVDLELN